MAVSPAQVVEALKQTPKGQLPYTSPLSNLSSSERLVYIKSLSTPPKLSPGIALDYIQRNTSQTPPASPSLVSHSPSSLSSSNNSDLEINVSPLVIRCADDDVLSSNEFRQLEVSIQKHVDKYSRFKHDIEQTREIRITEIHQETETRRHEHKLERLQEENIIRREVEEEMRQYAMSRQQHSEAVRKRIEENREIMRQREEEIKRERREIFMTLEKDVLTLNDRVRRLMESCRYGDLLDTTPIQTFATHCNEVIKIIIGQRESSNPDPTMLESCKVLVAQLLPLLTVIKDKVETANKNGDEIVKKRQEEEERKLKNQQQTNAQQPAQHSTTGTSTSTTGTSTSTTGTSTSTTSTSTSTTSTSTGTSGTSTNTTNTSTNSALPPGLKEYEELNKKLAEAVKLSSEFTSNTQLKKYRYSLQSAIAYMVGSISSDNGGRLLSLVNQIQQLLGGQTVEVLEKRVSINDHPLARNFCLHLLVKKMVDRVTEAPRNAFPVAGVVILLWKDINEFGQLFLAQCYQTCPLLVPIITQKTSGISEIDFKRLIGYRVSDDDTVENDDQFTDRMTPCIRLYGAILQTDIVNPHPHGLDKGWTLLARILNNKPLGSITIIMIYNLLEVTGHALLRKYKGQFKKLLHVLYTDYMNKIKPVSSPLDISKLQTFFENFIKEGKIDRPVGALTLQFWNEGERFSYQVD